MAKMERTSTPGIYKRGSRYVIVWQRRGRQHKSYHRTITEAREAKGRRAAGDRRPVSREPFEEYATRWLDTYRGRTSRGLSERTRRTYRRDLKRWAIPHFRGYRLEEVEPPDVRAFVTYLEGAGLRPASVRAILAPVKAMYATAVDDGAVRSNPTRDVRVGNPDDDTEGREVRSPHPCRVGAAAQAHTGSAAAALRVACSDRVADQRGDRAHLGGRGVRPPSTPHCASAGLPR